MYDRFAGLYDVVYGWSLRPGRRRARERLAPRAGERVLEVGVGTGLDLQTYPPGCTVVGVDLSEQMLRRAQRRVARRREPGVALCRMDASRLGHPEASFDAVYAPYLMNVVPDPVAVGRELRRVCRADGRIVLLNHFAAPDGGWRPWDRLGGWLAVPTLVRWDLELAPLLDATGLTATSIDAVNLGGVTSVVVCRPT